MCAHHSLWYDGRLFRGGIWDGQFAFSGPTTNVVHVQPIKSLFDRQVALAPTRSRPVGFPGKADDMARVKHAWQVGAGHCTRTEHPERGCLLCEVDTLVVLMHSPFVDLVGDRYFFSWAVAPPCMLQAVGACRGDGSLATSAAPCCLLSGVLSAYPQGLSGSPILA